MFVNDETHALVNRLGCGRSWRGQAPSYRGIALLPPEVVAVVVRLRGIRGLRGLSTRGRAVVDLLAERLKQYRRTGVAIIQDGPDRQYRDKIVRHECFHLFQYRYRNRLHKRSVVKALIKHPATSTAIPYLKKHGYDVGSAALIVEEVAACAFSGDHHFIGLRRREAADWLSAYFRQFAVPRCAQIPSN